MELEKLVRKNILELKPYTSARDKYQDGIFLDANENSFGSVIETDVKDLNRYPDPHQRELRTALSQLLKIDSNKIFFGVGSDEIIDLAIRIFCEPQKSNVIIAQPTYGMYHVACDINDVEVKAVQLDENFDIDVSAILDAVNEKTRMIFLCSPNNPTGNLLSKSKIKRLAKDFEGIIFLDEAYIDFTEKDSLINDLPDFNNVIVSRTFSKAWGLAGIRCGYCIADQYIIDLFFKVKAPYSISRLTSDAVIKSIKNYDVRNQLIKKIISEKAKIIAELRELKFVEEIYHSDANFLLVKMQNASRVFNFLNEKGFRTRMRNDDSRLKDCLRITVGNSNENELLLSTLKELL